ncbi:MAG: ABC transporter permease [Verrucomicrobiae bacterium]|nr:ABC transporter permease [Verrucomicrobiae bacterium]
MNDLRFALRQLLKHPGFTAVAVLTLALGIGVNTSMFSGLHSLLMPEQPYPEADRLVRVFRTSPHSQRWPHSPANFLDQRDQNAVFTHLAATTSRPANLSEAGQPAERLRTVQVTADLIPMLGIQPRFGRAFLPEESQPGRSDVVLLNHAFWLRRFNADAGIVGATIRLDGAPVTVVGVMPPEFADRQTWGRADLIRPLAFSDAESAVRGNHYLDVFARLKPGVSLAQANAGLATLAAHLRGEHPDTNTDSGLRVAPLATSRMDPRGQIMLWLIMGLAGFVLLIACANLANLQFARTALRSRELAIRGALGAPRGRLLRQLLKENLLLAVLGGGFGVLLAYGTNQWLAHRLTEDGRPLLQLELNVTVLAFAFLASTLSGLAFGLLPAWLASRTDLNATLKQGPRDGDGGTSRHRLRHGLIIAQVAMALMLLTGAGLVMNGLSRFSASDPGWRIDGLHAGYLNLSGTAYPDGEARRRFAERLQDQLAALPGVDRAALANALPVSGARSHIGLSIESPASPVTGTLSALASVSPDYFATLGIRLLDGREFATTDTAERSAVVIINESFARAFWPNGSALGQRIGQPDAWQEIVGVVADIRSATDPGEPTTRLQCYRPLAQDPASSLAVAVRGHVTGETLRRAVAELDPDLPLSEAGSVRAQVGRFFDQAAVAGGLLAAFAGLGLLLAALGTYGVIAGYVAQRTREIGVRMALGAQIRDVLSLVLGRGLRLTAAGLVLGGLGAVALARILASITPGLKPNAPGVVVLASALLLVVAFTASWLPARRAARVDPMEALRCE